MFGECNVAQYEFERVFAVQDHNCSAELESNYCPIVASIFLISGETLLLVCMD